MTSGRIAKPTALKLIAGNPGKRALNKREPKPIGRPSPPENMTTLGEIVWKRLIASMPQSVWSAADSLLLATYCEAAAQWSEATSYFRDGGERVVSGSTGQPIMSPWIKIQSDSARQMLQIGARLGLDPAARQSLNIGEDEKDTNPFLIQ